MQDAGYGIRNAECRMEDVGSKMQEARCRKQDAGNRMHDAQCRMQEARCRKKDARCSKEDAGSKNYRTYQLNKMRVFIITLSVLVLSHFSYAQERISHLEEGEIYKVSINLKDNGYLANLTDSSMQVSDIKCRFGARAGNKVYNYYDVERFSIKRSGDKLRRVLWSSGFGLITGILTSLVPVQNESNSWETTTTTMKIPVGTGAIIGLLGGAAVGLFTGTIKNHYSISKKKTAFRSAYTDLIQ